MNARHNGEAGRKIVSSARGEEGRTASSPPPPSAQVKQARQNKERNQDSQGREAEEQSGKEGSSLKERNGRIGAFPPRGYSTFMTKRREERRGEERRSTFIFVPAFVPVPHIESVTRWCLRVRGTAL